jgi:MFS family permease
MQASTQPKTKAGPLQVISALRHRNYRIYWIGFFTSIIGMQVQTVAMGWLVYDKTGSALNLGIVSGSVAVAAIVFSPFGGVMADRVDRRRLLIGTQSGALACSLALATLVTLDIVVIWQIAVIAFIFGSLQAFDQPARSALVPRLIDRSDLMNAVALTSVVWQSSAIIGPVIAGLVIGFLGLAPCFYLESVGFGVFIICLSLISVRKEDEVPRPHRGIYTDLLEGFAYIRANSIFMTLISISLFNAVFGLSFIVLLPVFAREELGLGPEGLGALFTAMGIGSLAGTLLVASLGDFQRKGLLIIGGACVFGALLIAFSLSTWIELSLALLVLLGVTRSLYMTSSQTVLQLRLEDRLRGRVTAVYGLTWSLMPLGGLQAGAVADVWGAPVAVAVGGVAIIVFTLLVGLRQPDFRLALTPAPAR